MSKKGTLHYKSLISPTHTWCGRRVGFPFETTSQIEEVTCVHCRDVMRRSVIKMELAVQEIMSVYWFKDKSTSL